MNFNYYKTASASYLFVAVIVNLNICFLNILYQN